MADRTPRIAPTLYNLAIALATIITGSSYEASLPLNFLRFPTPTLRWRTKLGWTIVAGFNDKIDFNRGGVKVATIAAGYYATGVALAVAIVAALEAADATPVWACSHSTSTKKFTISSDLSFMLLLGTGANLATSAGKDLGFAAADTASAITHTGDLAAYHSRAYLLFDLGSAMAVTIGIAHSHNMGTGGTVTLYGKTTNNPWVSPGTTQVLAGDDLASKRILAFGSQSFRYWALVCDDVQNVAGYNELGVPFIGTYWQSPRPYEFGGTRQAQLLSQLLSAADGALNVLARRAPKIHTVTLRWMPRADRDTYQAIEDARQPVFLMRDPNFPGADTVYGVLSTAASVIDERMEPPHYSFVIVLSEDIG